ncbi:DUF3077 domain-containing protein [Pseudomonas sp. 148P]|uniref:DUF3077 domain-containing protein n=1 Tax=Pseudomonas ulcerans TaxID=3115852 RepID=A0ABU7HWB8_9PSED|nr:MULTISPECIES: DUF3077 domain-containing protein [unclassified Pseudomonas]MEE1924654.1 DUF3077 domain-containing protein [Pseudomonas sp. 147P]MEE1935832.1 DUF3077 domain-containing protein [Pseudomonas sp. 148P]
MKKIVPDPPTLPRRPVTAHTHFGSCNNTHPHLFSVCAGISMEDALAHLAMVLIAASETNVQVCELAGKPVQGLAWATQQSLEMGQALVDSLLGGGGDGAQVS